MAIVRVRERRPDPKKSLGYIISTITLIIMFLASIFCVGMLIDIALNGPLW